jgi:hypothetical protein
MYIEFKLLIAISVESLWDVMPCNTMFRRDVLPQSSGTSTNQVPSIKLVEIVASYLLGLLFNLKVQAVSSSESLYPCTKLHDVTSQKMVICNVRCLDN